MTADAFREFVADPLGGFFSDLAYRVLVGVLVTSIVFGLGLFYRRKVRVVFRRFRYYLSNRRIPLSLIYIRKYNVQNALPISASVFDHVTKDIGEYDRLSLRNINDQGFTIASEKLSIELVVELGPEFDLATMEDESPNVMGYKLTVSTRTDIRWGRREIDDLNHFVRLADKLVGSVELKCLAGRSPTEQFLLLGYRQEEVPIVRPEKEISDPALGAKLSIEDHSVRATLASVASLAPFAKRYIPS